MSANLPPLLKRCAALLLILAGVALGLPLSAALQSGQQRSAPHVDGQTAAKILAAQLPLWAGADFQIYLPVSATGGRHTMP